MTIMNVLVIHAIDENERDLHIVMVARTSGHTMASPVVTLEGAADSCNGNPYLVYGDAIEEFTGLDKFETSISVFGCTSGNLKGWE